MYKYKKGSKSSLTSVEVVEGETIEEKVERIIHNNEPIKDGAPEIFTERKDGIIAAYNIKTDRWEIAAEAMDKISASIQAKRDGLPKIGHNEETTTEAAGLEKNSVAEPTQGKQESTK